MLVGRVLFNKLADFYGANPHDPLIVRSVLNFVEDARGRYKGYRDDVMDAVYWKRWLDKHSIGGLPPEIGQMVMMWSWQSWCLL